MAVNQQKLVIDYFDKVTGGPPTPATIQAWINRNPIYKLARSDTAIRYEAIGAFSAINMWEPFSILKSAGKPTEFIFYPYGLHSLELPAERLSSQGGAEDWFNFWLKGEESAIATDALTYSKWNVMKTN